MDPRATELLAEGTAAALRVCDAASAFLSGLAPLYDATPVPVRAFIFFMLALLGYLLRTRAQGAWTVRAAGGALAGGARALHTGRSSLAGLSPQRDVGGPKGAGFHPRRGARAPPAVPPRAAAPATEPQSAAFASPAPSPRPMWLVAALACGLVAWALAAASSSSTPPPALFCSVLIITIATLALPAFAYWVYTGTYVRAAEFPLPPPLPPPPFPPPPPLPPPPLLQPQRTIALPNRRSDLSPLRGRSQQRRGGVVRRDAGSPAPRGGGDRLRGDNGGGSRSRSRGGGRRGPRGDQQQRRFSF